MANVSGSAGPRGSSIRKKFIMGGSLLVILCVLGGVLYVLAMLNISYSDGERSGVLQKFSRKGWVCKTYEGEMAMSTTPGMAPVIWNFSVRDESVVNKINDALGKRVVVHYTEHRGVPSECFAETDYYVDGVRLTE